MCYFSVLVVLVCQLAGYLWFLRDNGVEIESDIAVRFLARFLFLFSIFSLLFSIMLP